MAKSPVKSERQSSDMALAQCIIQIVKLLEPYGLISKKRVLRAALEFIDAAFPSST
jgi:hypothetical protein